MPKHVKLSEKETKELLEKFQIRMEDLPRISMKDPAVNHMELTTGDIVKVLRKSQTSGMADFYRRVVK